MSHQDNFFDNSQSQEPLNFLKSVVYEDSGQVKNGTDSDKENEHRSIITSNHEFSLNHSAEPVKQQQQQTMSKEDAEMWDDFYNEDEFEELVGKDKNEPDSFRFGVNGNERTLDKVEEEEEEDYAEESNATDTVDSNSNTKENSTENKPDSDSTDRKIKRKRKKRLFKRVPPQPSSITRVHLLGGSHPNLGPHGNDSADQNSNRLETMSETSGTERKLSRRKQVSRPRCAGPAPRGDRLEQKYHELEHLMLKPLPNPAVYVQQTRQQMLRLQGLSSQYHKAAHDTSAALPPTGQTTVTRETGTGKVTRIIQEIEDDTNQAYSTIQTVHVVNEANRNNRPSSAHPRRRPMAGQRRNRPLSAGNTRPVTSDSSEPSSVLSNINLNRSSSRGRTRNGGGGVRKVRSDSNASSGSQKRSDRSESGSKDRDYSSSFEDGTRSRSGSRSPGRAILATDNHLKNSSNPALRQWLKTKDKEFRKQKLEERKKKRQERAEKQEEELKRQEFLEKAEEKVKEWMTQKKKEAWKLAKEERKRKKEEQREISEREEKYNDSLKGRPFTPIQRPEGKLERENKTSQQQQDNTPTTPHPPKSKFVYKRPVSGRVRLMKLQQERKEDSKKFEAKKKEMEKALAEEKERKMRMSYDQWLLKKREDDYAKRQESARQRAMAKSDSELDRIVPQVARRRIENIRRGKKRIDSGDRSINESVNKSFGGGDFGEDEENKKPSYRLEVSGDKKSLKERPCSAKPASSGMLNPKISKSPRRPKSANPRIQALQDESQDSNPDNSFKLPFPPDLGVPKYVAAKQGKLFSGDVVSNASKDSQSSKAESVEEPKESSVIEDNSGGVQGVDEVHAVPDLQENESIDNSQKDVKTDESSKGDKEEDQSFFVTHGNIEKEPDTVDENGLIENDEKVEEKEEDIPVNDNDDSVIDSSHSQNIEEKSETGTDVEDKDCDNVDEGNENEDDNLVPPLEFGDEDADINYEEESDGGDEEKMDFTEATFDGQTSKSILLDSVEESPDTPSVKSSVKHVSFSENNTIHEDPLVGISNDDDFFDDHFEQIVPDENADDKYEDPLTGLNISDSYDYNEDLDEIEGYQDEDDEAEDERGYFDSETPRDDF